MTQETRRDLRFSVLAVSVAVAAALVGVGAIARYPLVPASAAPGAIWIVATLVAAVVVSELLAILVPGTLFLSLSVPLFVAVAVYSGPVAAMLAGIASTLPSFFSRPRLASRKLLYNVGEVVLSTALPAVVYVELGAPLFAAPNTTFSLAAAPALLVAATLGTFVNVGLIITAVNVLYGDSLRESWRGTFSGVVPSQLVLGFVGIAIAQIVHTMGLIGFALFVVPLLVARQTYQQSVKLREAYADTISSLVAALEAKDLYTKGHSVRVAEYTVLIAREMGFTPEQLARIQQAALLHDLGKVGVSRRVLAKEAKLTDEEYEEIKRHPDIGAHIVADVPYLADLVPMIQHHHERLDGRGYGGGAAGTDIPIEARILAVADSYDAMTSVRPYRGAMSHEAAMQELIDNCGSQFDPQAVAAFERAYRSPAPTEMPSTLPEVALNEA
jgi:putative nucleotidyltransferase with HDIG domain